MKVQARRQAAGVARGACESTSGWRGVARGALDRQAPRCVNSNPLRPDRQLGGIVRMSYRTFPPHLARLLRRAHPDSNARRAPLRGVLSMLQRADRCNSWRNGGAPGQAVGIRAIRVLHEEVHPGAPGPGTRSSMLVSRRLHKSMPMQSMQTIGKHENC